MDKKEEIAKTNNALAPSTRFRNLVEREFEKSAGSIEITEHMSRLIQSFYTKLDSILKDNETKRLQKSGQYQDPLEFNWKNVNMEKMAQDCIAFAMVGLDPMQANQLFMIPYKNSHTQKYDIGFMPGYKGIEIKARKFGLDIPKHVTIELVYSSDEFEVIKKDFQNEVEHYRLDIKFPFKRGEIIGGFYYFQYDDPTKNLIRIFSLEEIEKRKPKYASPEFWGGEKDEYDKSGKKTGKKVAVDGWHAEMCFKTIYRAAYNSITIDSEKINDHFMTALRVENEYIENNKIVDTSYTDVTAKGESKKEALRLKKSEEKTVAQQVAEDAEILEDVPEVKSDAISAAANDLMQPMP